MKKSITFLLGLLLLSGVATKSYGQAAGDYVFTQATDTLWATVGNWSVSDGAGNLTAAPSTPTATTNVWIQAGKRMGTMGANTSGATTLVSGSTSATLSAASTTITAGMAIKGNGIARGTYVAAINGTAITLSQAATASGTPSLSYYPACKNLYVNGFMRTSAQFVSFGNITVNTGGTLTQGSDLYCSNIVNYGTFNATSGYRSSKSLYVGFEGAIPGNGDYSITNDGVFGDTAPKVPQGNTGGIKVLYSNQANSFTVKPSSSSVTGYAFNIAQLLPHANIKTTANTSLNIKETMSLLIHNGIGLSIQNNDTCTGTTRVCTIDPGVTVYVGYNFHANRNVTTNDQGNFTYNVYGTLDLGTYASASNNTTASAANTSDFGLCMTSVAGNAGTLTFNLGDGTQANAGTLVLGSNVKLIKQKTQTLSVNFKDYSTVTVTGNYGQAMNYQLLNDNNPALYLFPRKYYNLTLNGAGVVLPVVAGIKGTKTYTTVNTTANWIAATSAAQGSILYTGSAYYYVPVVRGTSTYLTQNPIALVADTVLQYLRAGQTVTGNNIPAATTVSAISGNSITLSAAPTATATQTNVFVTFTGKSDIATAPTGTSTNPFSPVMDGTQGLIYLGDATFATTSTVLTAVNAPNAASSTLVYSDQKNSIAISNATAGDIANVYTISGVRVASARLISDKATISIASGIYLVKVNNSVSKVVVK
ncbi:MAG: hypothetical protein RIS29_188 [Bacteroidota bacterium]|jgi:hypothetical protein